MGAEYKCWRQGDILREKGERVEWRVECDREGKDRNGDRDKGGNRVVMER